MDKRKHGNELEDMLNFPVNAQYCELKLRKFWHVVHEKKAAEIPIAEDDAQMKAFNDEYIKAHGKPPLSCLRIKDHGGYTTHDTPDKHCKNDRITSSITKTKSKPNLSDDDDTTVDELGILSDHFDDEVKDEEMSQLLLLNEDEEEKGNFTTKDKRGVPLYDTQDSKTKLQEDEKGSTNDIYSKKPNPNTYRQPRLVAPPEYPYRYYRLKKEETCTHCGGVGRNCHNIRYGMYLAAVVARYYANNKDTYNEFDAAKLYLSTYNSIKDFEEFLDHQHIDANTNVGIPYCLTMDSLVFALNSVEWSIMWSKTQPNVNET